MGEAALGKLPNQMPDLGLESPIALFNYVNMTVSKPRKLNITLQLLCAIINAFLVLFCHKPVGG